MPRIDAWIVRLPVAASCRSRRSSASPSFGVQAATAVLQNYLKRIGGRLAATPEARDCGFTFTFTVLNDAQANAFAVPGGPMFVNTGLFHAVDNEAQLAGAMAHEMGHVILRHGTTQLSKQNLLKIPAILAARATGRRVGARFSVLPKSPPKVQWFCECDPYF